MTGRRWCVCPCRGRPLPCRIGHGHGPCPRPRRAGSTNVGTNAPTLLPAFVPAAVLSKSYWVIRTSRAAWGGLRPARPSAHGLQVAGVLFARLFALAAGTSAPLTSTVGGACHLSWVLSRRPTEFSTLSALPDGRSLLARRVHNTNAGASSNVIVLCCCALRRR